MSGGLGSGPFGLGPFGSRAATLADQETSSLSSSRSIVPRTMRYELNDEGGFEPMDDIAQTAFLLLIREFGPRPQFVTARSEEEVRQRVRKALASLTPRRDPAIRIDRITVNTSLPGTLSYVVDYTNLRTNTKQTLEP
jgi:hypothetical protein